MIHNDYISYCYRHTIFRIMQNHTMYTVRYFEWYVLWKAWWTPDSRFHRQLNISYYLLFAIVTIQIPAEDTCTVLIDLEIHKALAWVLDGLPLLIPVVTTKKFVNYISHLIINILVANRRKKMLAPVLLDRIPCQHTLFITHTNTLCHPHAQWDFKKHWLCHEYIMCSLAITPSIVVFAGAKFALTIVWLARSLQSSLSSVQVTDPEYNTDWCRWKTGWWIWSIEDGLVIWAATCPFGWNGELGQW